MRRRTDLDERLLDLAVAISRIAQRLARDRLGNHVADQLVRSCTAPAAHYAEAVGAASRRDFVHKLTIGLKELRESQVWLRYAMKMGMVSADKANRCIQECNELIAIHVASIRTAKKNSEK